ncbi:prophage antirepressor-related protein [Clostridioides difficile]|uniref:BRO-N domain-containing protein n=1 Tax=Clostridioides difficile TaxID=1496 RepID=UPI000872A663|nr:toxin Bro [Clostridioides difficile]MDI2928310.1 toxin Bro [Clostridioides difficile]MDI6366050.1 toxin Bro [Clostridioides difficile]MDO0002535.1 toxin Bro [Clostridioides difficile]NIZ86857.1 toxin Bro [Clostridioides difficile]OFA29021.1 toxin Bro [Clostridioides difficile]
MNNELMNFENNELGIKIRTIKYEDGSIGINAEDTAVGFGWCQTQNKNGKQYVSIRWETINKYCKEFGFLNLLGKDEYIPESLFYLLGMKAKNEIAVKFQTWLAVDVLPSIRQTGAYITNNANPKKLREKASEIEKLQLAYNSTSMLKELLDGAGFDNKSKLLTAKTLYKKAGIDLPIEIEEEESFFDTKQIASKLKIYSKSNKPAQLAVCEIIKKIDLEDSEVKGVWETNGSWTGTVNKYTESVIDKVSKWIEENNRPTKIAGEKKNFHVVYKIE